MKQVYIKSVVDQFWLFSKGYTCMLNGPVLLQGETSTKLPIHSLFVLDNSFSSKLFLLEAQLGSIHLAYDRRADI
jgi:hypothetical protein